MGLFPDKEKINMKTIQIVGSGCAKCMKLAENAETAAKQLGIEYELIKITDINEIVKLGVMMTPALILDGTMKTSGRVASVDEIKKWLV